MTKGKGFRTFLITRASNSEDKSKITSLSGSLRSSSLNKWGFAIRASIDEGDGGST